MKIVCSQDELLAKLQIAARGVSQRSTVQILSGILLRAPRRARRSWPPPTWSSRCGCRSRPGRGARRRRAARAAAARDRARAAGRGRDHRAAGRHRCRCSSSCGAGRYSLHTQSAEDFPQLPVPTGSSFTVDRAAFVDTVSHVGRAASKDESRPVLTGVLVEFGEGTVTMAATDSYRLSVKESPLPGAAGEAQAIVPARALGELARHRRRRRPRGVRSQENQVLFGLDGVWLSARRIDGQFPELPAAAAADVRARDRDRPRTSCWT